MNANPSYLGGMSQVRLTVSLSSSDVAALDRYMRMAGLKTRSAAIQRAIRLLGDREAEHDYAAAWEDWETSEDARLWAAAETDGLSDARR